ncbi:hypothetical protein V5799_025219 [Amblyomma americanum]|uniref:Uncharacterized protein n=1 Tax=Amblyomma americanum TaxID=6943 RepID=A0AAQ4EAD3_AMBAM
MNMPFAMQIRLAFPGLSSAAREHLLICYFNCAGWRSHCWCSHYQHRAAATGTVTVISRVRLLGQESAESSHVRDVVVSDGQRHLLSATWAVTSSQQLQKGVLGNRTIAWQWRRPL